MLNGHWKDWCWSWSSNTLATWCKELTQWKRLWCEERLKADGEGMTEDEVVGWYHWLEGHELEQAPGVGDGHGSLVCCSPWGHKELDLTEQLNWTELNHTQGTVRLVLLLSPFYGWRSWCPERSRSFTGHKASEFVELGFGLGVIPEWELWCLCLGMLEVWELSLPFCISPEIYRCSEIIKW